ncbi:MAG: DUF454 domain-containing protein [Rhodobacteraceae bacterium]|nr:DUF454 domain-containing protein [Paracoccaceae bacterium]
MKNVVKLWLQTPCSTLAQNYDWQLAVRQIFYLVLAWLCVGAGVLGIFLPLLPTTPFLLVALWGFMRSSPRLEQWLRNHSIFGPYITDWSDHGIVPVRAKVIAVSMMTLSLTWLTFFSNAGTTAVVLVGLTMAIVAVWLVLRPSQPSGGA